MHVILLKILFRKYCFENLIQEILKTLFREIFRTCKVEVTLMKDKIVILTHLGYIKIMGVQEEKI